MTIFIEGAFEAVIGGMTIANTILIMWVCAKLKPFAKRDNGD